VVQRLSAVATLVLSLLVVLVASAQPSPDGAGRSGPPVQGEFARHPQISAADRELLARAGGVLWWVDQRCRVSDMSLATRQVGHVEGEHCRFWPNPQSTVALATVGGGEDSIGGRRLAVIDLTDRRGLRQVATVHHPDGILASSVAWDSNGRRAAFCIATSEGPRVVEVTAFTWDQHEFPGACYPTWLSGDRLAFVRGGRVVSQAAARQGGWRTVGVRRLLERTTRSSPYTITALAATPGRPPFLALGVARRTQFGHAVPPAALVVADARGNGINVRPGAADPLRDVGVAPDGRGAWYRDPGTGRASLVTGPPLHGFPTAVPTEAWSYSWAPGGAFVAVAEGDRIAVFDWRTGASAVIDGVASRDLQWVS
jgi:hypothetical protein